MGGARGGGGRALAPEGAPEGAPEVAAFSEAPAAPAFSPAALLPTLPRCPGVYIMRGAGGEVIYVGKAKDLRARLRQYFPTSRDGAAQDPRPFVATLPRALTALDTITTATEKEALLLERELILTHAPKHNVALKFGSGHLYLRLDGRADWPRVEVLRDPRRDERAQAGARLFGPYLSGADLRAMLTVVERTFKLRTCDDRDFKNRSRPCMQHQIKRCLAPCALAVDRADYAAEVEGAAMFLRGERPALRAELERRMREAAAALEFERAARYRDQVAAIDRSLEPQAVTHFTGGARECDAVGVYREGDQVQVALLEVRGGVLLRARPFSFEEQGASTPDLLATLLHLYYAESPPPPEVLLDPAALSLSADAHAAADSDADADADAGADADGAADADPAAASPALGALGALAERLRELWGGAVRVSAPARGQRRRLVEMAAQNAEQAFFQAQRALGARQEALWEVKRLLRLSQVPWRAECYDISLFHGEAPYASQVVFEGGVPRRADYRVRRIEGVGGTDDFAMLREALTRRLRAGLAEGDLPQLLVIDGGKGQLAVAVAACEDLGVRGVDVVSLAKSRAKEGGRTDERVFLPGARDPVPLRPGSPSFRLLTQLRDEAHKTALSAHRKARSAARLRSPLDELPGVGPARRKALLRAFGDLDGVARAPLEELAAVVPAGVARAVWEALAPLRG